jgi:hypothetical protein
MLNLKYALIVNVLRRGAFAEMEVHQLMLDLEGQEMEMHPGWEMLTLSLSHYLTK